MDIEKPIFLCYDLTKFTTDQDEIWYAVDIY